jgi:AmmeMemoRadiSam system protein B
MDIRSYTREEIEAGVDKAYHETDTHGEGTVRVLFAPTEINDENFEQACDIYSRLKGHSYDTVVIVESLRETLDHKLPMPSKKRFTTPLGEVPVNDTLRNVFCDEDDDFFIDDEGYHEDLSLFSQLMMLQCTLDSFDAVSLQIADESPAIIKELAYVLEDVMRIRNALIVFCCDMSGEKQKDFKRLKNVLEDKNPQYLINFLNQDEQPINGRASFLAGVLVTQKWDLNLQFLNGKYAGNPSNNLLTGYAEMKAMISP